MIPTFQVVSPLVELLEKDDGGLAGHLELLEHLSRGDQAKHLTQGTVKTRQVRRFLKSKYFFTNSAQLL